MATPATIPGEPNCRPTAWGEPAYAVCRCGHFQVEHDRETGKCPVENPESFYRFYGYSAAPPVSEPAPMPPVEVGDWVHEQGDEYAFIVDSDYSGLAHGNEHITEIRKADGRVWRRADRKEPGQ